MELTDNQFMKKIRILFFLFCLVACKQETGYQKSPEKLIIGFVPSEEAARMVKSLTPVTKYLSKKLNTPVTLFKGSDYTTIIEAMRGEKLDIAVFGPFSYVLASKKVGAQPLVIPADKEGKLATYNSLIIANKKAGLKNLDELVAGEQKFTMSFSDPASTSGHLVPRGHLISLGLKPETHFKNTLFSGSHTATILALASGKVDVAGCSFTVFNKMIKRGMLDINDVVVLWKSSDLPVDLVTIRKGISNEFKAKIKNAYVQMAYEAPETASYFYEEWNDSSLIYIPANDSMYSEIHRLAAYVYSDINH